MKIYLNEESHLRDFVELNNAWIKQYFKLEENDLNIAKNDAINICNILLMNYHIPYHFLSIRFSSNKGFFTMSLKTSNATFRCLLGILQ